MKTLCLLCAIALACAPAGAVLIDFSQTPPGTFESYSEAGAEFRSEGGDVGLTSDLFGDTPNGTRGLICAGPPFDPIRADFLAARTFVAVDIGDFDEDQDDLFLRAYNSNDELIAEDTESITADFTGMVRLRVVAPDIAYTVFGGVGANDSSVFVDNFVVFTVPGPGAASLLGLAALACRRRVR